MGFFVIVLLLILVAIIFKIRKEVRWMSSKMNELATEVLSVFNKNYTEQDLKIWLTICNIWIWGPWIFFLYKLFTLSINDLSVQIIFCIYCVINLIILLYIAFSDKFKDFDGDKKRK